MKGTVRSNRNPGYRRRQSQKKKLAEMAEKASSGSGPMLPSGFVIPPIPKVELAKCHEVFVKATQIIQVLEGMPISQAMDVLQVVKVLTSNGVTVIQPYNGGL